MKIQSAKAGIGTGRAGLQAASGLFSSAGLFSKGVTTFDPLALNPYAFFDGESYKGTLENPTLDLDPSNPDSLDVITATRAGTTATYTDSSGLIQVASADTVRVDYTQGAELTPPVYQHVVQTDYSASPNVIGTKVTLSDISGPDGESGGVRVTETANNTQHYLAVKNKEIASGTTYTVSFYVKEGAYPSVKFYTQSAKIYSDVTFNFSTGTATFGGPDLIANSGSVSNVGGGWYRVVYSATAHGSGEMDLYVCSKDLSSYAGDVNNSTDYYGFQVEEGTTATDFVANTTGSPKFTGISATFAPRVPMILCEPSATNLVESSDINSDWGFYSNDSNITQHASDLGGINAYVLSRIGSNQKTSLEHGNISGGSTTNATASLFYKNIGEARFFQFWDTNLSNSKIVNVDTISDAFNASAGSVKITILANGWRRLEWTRPDNNLYSSGQIRLSLADSLGDSRNSNFSGTGGIAFAGFQLEEGDLATSFIPTSGGDAAARTRAADNLEITGSDFDFYNQSEGTFYQEVSTKRIDATDWYLSANDNTNNSALRFTRSSGTHRVTVAGQTEKSFSTAVVGQIHRLAMSHDSSASEFRASVDGVDSSPNPITGVTIPTNLTKLNIGSRYNGTAMCGHIKRVIFWPYSSENL